MTPTNIERRFFSQIPDVLVLTCDLPDEAIMLYARLWAITKFDGFVFTGSIRKTLARKLGMSKDKTHRNIKTLESACLINVGSDETHGTTKIELDTNSLWNLNAIYCDQPLPRWKNLKEILEKCRKNETPNKEEESKSVSEMRQTVSEMRQTVSEMRQTVSEMRQTVASHEHKLPPIDNKDIIDNLDDKTISDATASLARPLSEKSEEKVIFHIDNKHVSPAPAIGNIVSTANNSLEDTNTVHIVNNASEKCPSPIVESVKPEPSHKPKPQRNSPRTAKQVKAKQEQIPILSENAQKQWDMWCAAPWFSTTRKPALTERAAQHCETLARYAPPPTADEMVNVRRWADNQRGWKGRGWELGNYLSFLDKYRATFAYQSRDLRMVSNDSTPTTQEPITSMRQVMSESSIRNFERLKAAVEAKRAAEAAEKAKLGES